MRNFKQAFTMIELIFVIVILGILASVALPKFGDTKNRADITKAKSEIAAIRSGIINERQDRLIEGNSSYMLSGTMDTGGLFGGVLMYPLKNQNSSGNWYTATTGNGSYIYNIEGKPVVFTYDSSTGRFDCNSTAGATYKTECESLTQ